MENFIEQFEEYKITNHGVRMPEVSIPKEEYLKLNLDTGVSNEELLTALSRRGLKDKIDAGIVDKNKITEYSDRFKLEMNTLRDGGFIEYILLVWQIIHFCRVNDIPTGAARGSSAGSLILFLVGVTDIDPLKYNLYFERFLSRARIKKNIVDGITYLDGGLVPDVDMDLGHQGRERVVQFLLDLYKGKSCKLSTLSTLTTKILIKECGKIVSEITEQKMNEVSSYISSIFGKVLSIDEAIKDNEHFKSFCNENPKVIKIARKLGGLIKNKGSHASGYLVSFDSLDNCMPIEFGSNEEIVSAYDMQDAQEIAIKVDLLGLQDVTLISNVCKSLNLNVSDINPNDTFIYDSLKGIETPYGLFQVGADCNFRVMKEVRPRNINELSCVISLARPGALAYVEQFVKYVNTGEGDSVHSFFDDILKPTGYIPIFQEQMMQMAHKIGFTLDEAETLRKIVGKKQLDKIPEWEDKVRNKVEENKLDPKIFDVFFKLIKESASYSFNASHSYSYSVLAAQSIYLKFKYPLEFFLESLRLAKDKQDISAEINLIQSELKYFNINLLPPDLVKSDLDFKKEGTNLRFGLSAIKGISDKSLERLKEFLSAEKVTKFDAFNAAQNSKLNIGIVSALIQAGTLSSIDEDRPRLVFESQMYNQLTPREKLWCMENGSKYGYSLFNILLDAENVKDKTGKLVFKESRLETLKKKAEPYRNIYKINSKAPELASYVFETKLLGFSYSQKLSKLMNKYSQNTIMSLFKSKFEDDDSKFSVTGDIIDIQERTSKKGKGYVKIDISDESGKIELLVFEPNLSKLKEQNKIPVIGDIVIADIQKWNGTCTVKDLKVCTDKVYLKLSELKTDD